jgi:hypothetical protein
MGSDRASGRLPRVERIAKEIRLCSAGLWCSFDVGDVMSKVFISYSHDSQDHRDRVLALSQRLRKDGVETIVDQYVNGSPPEGWPRWMLDQIERSEFVLVVCTETYYRRFRGHEQPGKGKGANWEGALVTQEIYDSGFRSEKYIPVFLSEVNESWIPEPLRARTYHAVTSQSAYDGLYDQLLAQSGAEPAELGTPKRKDRRKGQDLSFDEPSSPPPVSSEAVAQSPIAGPQRPSRPPAANLMDVLSGHWLVQIQVPYAPGPIGQMHLQLLPDGLFRGQLTSPMGTSSVEGQWQADPTQNQVGLQGVQTDGFNTIPYGFIIQVSAFDQRQVHGITSAGEQVTWQRLP